MGELGQLGEVGRPIVHRRLVELVITAVDDQPGRCVDPQPDGIRDGMADVEEFHLEGTDLDHFTGLHRAQIGFVREAVTRQFDLDQAARQGRGVDRGRDLAQQVVERADVVFMAVGEEDAADA